MLKDNLLNTLYN